MSSAAASSYLKSPLTGFCEQQVTNDLNRPSARYGHRSVSLANRFLIVYGGALANGELDDQLYVFDSIKNYWFKPVVNSSCSPPGLASFGMTTDKEHHVFIFGGIKSSNQINNSLYILDSSNWKWTELECKDDRYLNGSFGCSLDYYDGYLLLFGGVSIKHFGKDEILVYNNEIKYFYVLKYFIDPKYDYGWSNLECFGRPPRPRESHSSLILNNCLYIIGGTGSKRLNDIWKFDLENYEWTPLGCFSKTKGRSMHSSIEMKGNIFVFGGWITVENDDVKEGISLTTGAIGTFNENLKPNHFENHLDSNSQDFPKPQISLLPRANHSSSNIGNRVYFFGGKTCLVNTNSNNKLSNDLKSTINDNFSYLDIGPPEKFLEIKNLKAEPLSITLNLNQEGDITSVYVFLTTDTSEETLQNIPDECLYSLNDLNQINLDFVYDPLKLSYKPLVPGKSYRLTIIPKNNYSIGSQKIHHVSTLPANINPIFAFKKLKANGEILEISWIHRRDYDIYYKIFAVPLSFDNNCIENFDKPYLVYEGSDTRCRIPYETLKEISYRTSLGLLLRLAFYIFGAESKDVLYKIETTFHVY